MGSSSALAFTDVSMVFDDGTEALHQVSFSVHRGEFVALVGPSGCGKSTLLRIAAGLVEPTSGSVAVDRRRIGFVFQDPTLLPWRSVRANVELFAELQGVSSADRRRLAADAIDRVGLSEFADHRPATLSGGMKMRVSLARSLTLSPTVHLFDEPFAAVDELTRERLVDEVQSLFCETGFAGLLVTHSIAEAVHLANRVVVLSPRPGRIVAEFEVPWEHPRPLEHRYSPEAAVLAGKISSAMRGS